MKSSEILTDVPDYGYQNGYFFIRLSGQLTLLLPVVLTGLAYIILQWLRTGAAVDAMFVGLLFGASIILVYGISAMGNHLVKKSLPFLLSAMDGTDKSDISSTHTTLCSRVLGTTGMVMAGLVYGTAIALAPTILGLWPDDPVLRTALSVFLFTVNVITGAGLYSLIRFIEQIHQITPGIQIDLWQAHSEKTDFLLGMTRKLTILASLYISVSMISILFSTFTISPIILAYAAFSGIIFLVVLVVTPAPIAKKLKSAKLETLHDLDMRIQELFKNGKTRGQLDNNDQISKLKNLLDLREKIENMNTWPFKVKSLLAGLSVIFFSTLPVMVRIILDHFF